MQAVQGCSETASAYSNNLKLKRAAWQVDYTNPLHDIPLRSARPGGSDFS